MLILVVGGLLYGLIAALDKLDSKKYPTLASIYTMFTIVLAFLYTGYCLYFVYDLIANTHPAIPVRMVQ